MNKVPPAAGQVWESGNVNKIIDEVTPSRVFYNGDCWESYNGFIIDNIFIPQSDLELLAVTLVEYPCITDGLLIGWSPSGTWQSSDVKTESCRYKWEDIQNMRYDLGLDEKPQKETKMIDLSTAKVGDDYEDEKGNVFEVTANGPINVVVKSPHDGGFFIVNHDGSFFGLTSLQLVTKHDNRHWLKDLPDADLFKLYQTSDIECNEFGVWVANSLGAHTLTLSGNKMPKLKGDEYKLSKISIPDLKAWQEQQVK